MPRVLIVDDHRDVRQVLRASLETLSREIQVVDVPSGEEAMLVLANQHFDLLVADVHLPGLSGLELKQWAQVKNPSLKLILITGIMDPKVRQQVMDAAVDAYFFKPVGISEFLTAVELCLNTEEVPPASSQTPPPVSRAPGVSADEGLPSQIAKPASPSVQPPSSLVFSSHEPEEIRAEARQQETMSERLSRLRRNLAADIVLIFDETGQVVSQAGDLRDVDLDRDLLPAFRVEVSTSARIASMLGMDTAQAFSVHISGKIRLFVSPVGSSWGLVAAISDLQKAKEINLIAGELLSVAADLQRILGAAIPAPVSSQKNQIEKSEVEPEQGTDEDALEMTHLFDERTSLPPDEVDAFWESLAEEGEKKAENGDFLNYDQAARLGLTPQPPEE